MQTQDHTARLAKQIGTGLGPGDCLLLDGPVGAGKTHFARALIWSLMGASEDVPSPTFTLVQTYETRAGELWHGDLYRLSATPEIEELGLTEAFEKAICLIEWPELLGPLTPAGALSLHFRPDPTNEDARHVILDSPADRWSPLLKKLAHDP